jgi:apolipoprotein N-acyltransferase
LGFALGTLRGVNDGGNKWRDWALAAGAGLVWACAFPPVTFLPAAWLAPALLLAATRAAPGRAFRLGFVAGIAHYFTSLAWVLYIPVAPGNIAGWLALSTYCSVYPAAWAALCWYLFPGDSEKPIREALVDLSFGKRLGWGASCALGWVALECLRGWVITGFPWNYLGASQLEFTRLAMLAQFTGVLGVSLVVAWGSVGGLLLVRRWCDKKKFEPMMLKELAGPAVLLAVAVGLGSFALAQPLGAKRDELKIALIQPSIPQTVLWNLNDKESQHKRFAQLMDLSDIAVEKNPDLIVWPEASVPPLRLLDPEVVVPRLQSLNAALRENQIWRVWGADRFENNAPLNSSVLMDPDGNELAYYSKQHLVMFGEYVPFGEELPFLKRLAPVGNFARGKGPEVFDMGRAKMSVIICFEDVVPKLARRAATPEVDFLLNLTNDGWFGQSHQQWQHARSAAWRAIETRRPLVRCTNNGITCWVDEHGHFHGVKPPVHSPRVNIVTIPLRKGPRVPTVYQRVGDWLPWGAVAVCAGLILVRRKKGSASGSNPAN